VRRREDPLDERARSTEVSRVYSSEEAVQSRGNRGTDRRAARRFVTHDRRTGFDRRKRYPVTGALQENPLLLLAVLVAVNVLSALDFVLTWSEMNSGIAAEGNPVLASLFEQGPGLAWLFKTTVVLAVSVVIWRERHRRAVVAVALGALCLYALVIVYHLGGIATASPA